MTEQCAVQRLAPTSCLTPKEQALKNAAVELEANFLAEMFKAAGLGETPDAFGGGAGEEQFASFLRQEEARAVARKGGVGLSESIFEALVRRSGDAAEQR
ncbi:MAG: rod-binding protein [Defluviimonas sp.]|uniref:rod-binding protein n=1 Tax=Albidovulum sp. TaxID=1872424 RepID=UPI002A2E4821|nr:rod-binding protein [Defluviimonas sp.]